MSGHYILSTNTKFNSDVKVIKINHPYHPQKGKVYEYLGLIKSNRGVLVRCKDTRGNLKKIPISFTDLYTSTINECSNANSCVASIDDLMSLKELLDAILSGFTV